MKIGDKIRDLVFNRDISLEEFCNINNLSKNEILGELKNDNPDYDLLMYLYKKYPDLDSSKSFLIEPNIKKTDKERLDKLLNYLRMSRNALGLKIGGTNGMRFQNIYAGRNKISAKLAKSITDIYPEISYNWLLTGRGGMFNSIKEDILNMNISQYEMLNEKLAELESKYEELETDFKALLKNLKLACKQLESDRSKKF